MDKVLYMITDFEEYTRQSEPHKCEKGYTWQTAIGLQAVDDLKNRHLHMSAECQSVTEDASKCNTCTLNCTLEELALLNFVKEKPNATQKEIAAHTGKSEWTVKTMTVKLSEQGVIERKNDRCNGYWNIKNNEMNN